MSEEVETPELSEAEKVKKSREELKAENDAYEAELLRAEKIRAEKVKAGRSGMQAPAPEKTPEQIWEEGVEERYKGTGLDPRRKKK